MNNWNKFHAVVRDRSGKKHSPPESPIIVWAVNIGTAREKLVAEYPARGYEIISLDPAVKTAADIRRWGE